MLAIVVYWKLKNLLLLGSVNGISMKPFTSCKLSLPESYANVPAVFYKTEQIAVSCKTEQIAVSASACEFLSAESSIESIRQNGLSMLFVF